VRALSASSWRSSDCFSFAPVGGPDFAPFTSNGSAAPRVLSPRLSLVADESRSSWALTMSPAGNGCATPAGVSERCKHAIGHVLLALRAEHDLRRLPATADLDAVDLARPRVRHLRRPLLDRLLPTHRLLGLHVHRMRRPPERVRALRHPSPT
jgi:hypothetical protein